jgi:hypothetical protein
MSQDQPIAYVESTFVYEKGSKLRTFFTRPGEQVSSCRIKAAGINMLDQRYTPATLSQVCRPSLAVLS